MAVRAGRLACQGNPFLWLAEMLQYDLDNSYTGRAA